MRGTWGCAHGTGHTVGSAVGEPTTGLSTLLHCRQEEWHANTREVAPSGTFHHGFNKLPSDSGPNLPRRHARWSHVCPLHRLFVHVHVPLFSSNREIHVASVIPVTRLVVHGVLKLDLLTRCRRCCRRRPATRVVLAHNDGHRHHRDDNEHNHENENPRGHPADTVAVRPRPLAHRPHRRLHRGGLQGGRVGRGLHRGGSGRGWERGRHVGRAGGRGRRRRNARLARWDRGDVPRATLARVRRTAVGDRHTQLGQRVTRVDVVQARVRRGRRRRGGRGGGGWGGRCRGRRGRTRGAAANVRVPRYHRAAKNGQVLSARRPVIAHVGGVLKAPLCPQVGARVATVGNGANLWHRQRGVVHAQDVKVNVGRLAWVEGAIHRVLVMAQKQRTHGVVAIVDGRRVQERVGHRAVDIVRDGQVGRHNHGPVHPHVVRPDRRPHQQAVVVAGRVVRKHKTVVRTRVDLDKTFDRKRDGRELHGGARGILQHGASGQVKRKR
eukprot:m.134190 g.134190  ORF g.134190 m.134190 type:complete len:495 (+) comp11378_c0_seq1:214-1698(+)